MKINYALRKHQMEVYKTQDRFNVLLAHRRFGKTVLAVMISVLENLKVSNHKQPQTFYYAPTFSQAKKVAWSYFKDFTKDMGAVYNESELKIDMPNGGIIYLGSADNPDASRGLYAHHVVMDEPAQMPTRMFTEVIRPALSDHKGGLLMIGTPQGRNGLFYDKYQDADDNPGWSKFMYKASETAIIDDEELKAARRDMSKSEYDQEYECSWDAAIRGAYFASSMDESRITSLVYDETKLVHCSFDLGMSDSTAVWFFQLEGEKVRVIDHQEYQSTGIPDIVRDLRKKPYNYGPMIFPNDVMVASLSTGNTRKRTLEALGVEVVVAPKCMDLVGDIDVTRSFLKNVWFDKDKCRHGIEALRQYRNEWIEKRGVLSLRPLHDWCSHSSDAMRYLATTPLDRLDSSSWAEELVYASSGRH